MDAPSNSLTVPPAAGLRLVASPCPFSDRVVDIELPAGGTILDMLRVAGAETDAMLGGAHVYIVDRAMTKEAIYIPRENWHLVRPKPGMHVSIRVVATPRGGGGGGGKNPMRTILTIAVMAAAFYVGASLSAWANAPGGLGWGEVGSLVFGGLGAAATPLVGASTINAILPPGDQ